MLREEEEEEEDFIEPKIQIKQSRNTIICKVCDRLQNITTLFKDLTFVIFVAGPIFDGTALSGELSREYRHKPYFVFLYCDRLPERQEPSVLATCVRICIIYFIVNL